MVRTRCVAVVAVMLLAGAGLPGVAAAQTVNLESFAGTWEGTAQTPNGDLALKSSFKVENGKLTGAIESSMGLIPVASAALADDKLTAAIDFQGTPGTFACKLQGSRIEGTWEVGGNSGTFWLTRPGAAIVGGADPVTGTWSGEVQVGGDLIPFSLVLRLNGETVTGEVTAALGSVPLSSGSWKDGALLLGFPYVSGEPVSMGAQLQDGKLVGVVDYNKGEATGTWTAVRK